MAAAAIVSRAGNACSVLVLVMQGEFIDFSIFFKQFWYICFKGDVRIARKCPVGQITPYFQGGEGGGSFNFFTLLIHIFLTRLTGYISSHFLHTQLALHTNPHYI